MSEKNKENDPTYNSIKDNKTLKNKFKQGAKSSKTFGKKKSKQTQINRKVSYVHGQEELMLLKCPY